MPYCIACKWKLRDTLIVRYFYHFHTMVSICKNKNFINCHNNVFVLYIKAVSEMKKLSHNLTEQNQRGSLETASSGWRWVDVMKLYDNFQFPFSKPN